jgi:hypothetical protein
MLGKNQAMEGQGEGAMEGHFKKDEGRGMKDGGSR